ncbi:MAG: hypothetical protein HKL90_01835 [Elusimicrobia bacterium]|nr:hypothetical protein [Elusimicrobiota bacterium]
MEGSEAGERTVALAVLDPDFARPLPIVLAKDGTVVLSYLARRGHKSVHILVAFHVAFAHRLLPSSVGGPARGEAFEVKGSAWARDVGGGKGKHYVFIFPDATFECVAEGYGSETIEEDADVVRLMARRLYR